MDIKIRILLHGFYPKGGGIVKASINPTKIQPLKTKKRVRAHIKTGEEGSSGKIICLRG